MRYFHHYNQSSVCSQTIREISNFIHYPGACIMNPNNCNSISSKFYFFLSSKFISETPVQQSTLLKLCVLALQFCLKKYGSWNNKQFKLLTLKMFNIWFIIMLSSLHNFNLQSVFNLNIKSTLVSISEHYISQKWNLFIEVQIYKELFWYEQLIS